MARLKIGGIHVHDFHLTKALILTINYGLIIINDVNGNNNDYNHKGIIVVYLTRP
jgi:hypothetical protein